MSPNANRLITKDKSSSNIDLVDTPVPNVGIIIGEEKAQMNLLEELLSNSFKE